MFQELLETQEAPDGADSTSTIQIFLLIICVLFSTLAGTQKSDLPKETVCVTLESKPARSDPNSEAPGGMYSVSLTRVETLTSF